MLILLNKTNRNMNYLVNFYTSANTLYLVHYVLLLYKFMLPKYQVDQTVP